MAEFAQNNSKNAKINYTSFELNCGYHSRVSFEIDFVLCLRSRFFNKLVKKLKELMEICCQILLHTQELQKRSYNKGVKNRSYTTGEKVWLNSKYIKTKRNKKLKSIFF